MDRIISLQQYKNILVNAKQNGFTLSNCFFLPKDINQKVVKESLLFKPIQNGLLLLDDLCAFYRCYYFLSAKDEPGKIQFDKDAVIEIPFNNVLNEKQLSQIEKIKAMGFSLGRESSVMTCRAATIVEPYIDYEGGACCFAVEDDAKQVFDLINLIFNPLYSFLPSMKELCEDIKENRVIVIKDEKKIAAALISSFDKKIATIKQVAVNPDYRGKQFGKKLLQAYHNKYKEEAISFQHWVDLNNIIAINMYRKFGYEFGLRKANEYIFTVKEN